MSTSQRAERTFGPDTSSVVSDLHRLRSDTGLALLMAERLARMGEVGSAARLVGEARAETRRVFGDPLSVPRPRRLRRRAVTALAAATVLGTAMSAAALVGPSEREPSRVVGESIPASGHAPQGEGATSPVIVDGPRPHPVDTDAVGPVAPVAGNVSDDTSAPAPRSDPADPGTIPRPGSLTPPELPELPGFGENIEPAP